VFPVHVCQGWSALEPSVYHSCWLSAQEDADFFHVQETTCSTGSSNLLLGVILVSVCTGHGSGRLEKLAGLSTGSLWSLLAVRLSKE
jgi:hypothetical protein